MVADALREALSAARDAWQAVQDDFPLADDDAKAAVLQSIDNAILELEDAMRLFGVPE